MNKLKLRPDLDDVMDRTTRFCTSSNVGSALVMVNLKQKDYPVKGLDEWHFPDHVEAFLDETIKAFEHVWKGRALIEDDLIPAMAPRYGIAEHSAFVAEGRVDFSAHTSWPHPVIHDYGSLDRLALREENVWLRMVTDGLAYLREKGEGRFAVKLRGAMAPMDLANALRGNDMFLDIYEYPDELHRLLAFCVEAGHWFISKQKSVVGDFFGGTLIGPGLWMPGNAIGHLSEDASVLCSPDVYMEFGKPYTEQLVAPYDVANMHLHTAGVHAFEGITSIDKLQSFELAPDPKQPRGIRVYRDTFNLFRDRIMRLFITLDEIRENIGLLKKANTILQCNAESIDEAMAVSG